MNLLFANVFTRSRSRFRPSSREPGATYSEVGICAWSNMTREPTCRINGWTARVEFNIVFSSSGCISWVEGMVVAASGSADCARAGDWINTNVITATLPIMVIDLTLIWGSQNKYIE